MVHERSRGLWRRRVRPVVRAGTEAARHDAGKPRAVLLFEHGVRWRRARRRRAAASRPHLLRHQQGHPRHARAVWRYVPGVARRRRPLRTFPGQPGPGLVDCRFHAHAGDESSRHVYRHRDGSGRRRVGLLLGIRRPRCAVPLGDQTLRHRDCGSRCKAADHGHE